MTSFGLFNQSVYPFRAFIFGFKIALILKTSAVAPCPFRERTSACPRGPWSKIGTFFESILYNATREGSILDSSIVLSCDIFRPIRGRYLSRDFRTRKTLYWNLIFTGFKFSLNSNRMMTHFDDSFWWLISMTHCDSFWSWQIWSNRFQPRFNFGSEFFHQIIYDLIYFHFKLYRVTPIRAHFIENIPDINMVCLNSKCSIAPQRHLAVEMFRFNQFISVATYQNDFSLLAKRIHAMWFCFPTNSNHVTLVTHTHDSWAMSHHDFLNVKIFSILIFWTITS